MTDKHFIKDFSTAIGEAFRAVRLRLTAPFINNMKTENRAMSDALSYYDQHYRLIDDVDPTERYHQAVDEALLAHAVEVGAVRMGSKRDRYMENASDLSHRELAQLLQDRRRRSDTRTLTRHTKSSKPVGTLLPMSIK